jgi:hypothetical protein
VTAIEVWDAAAVDTAAKLPRVKWPRKIVEITPRLRDSRAERVEDPMVTQKISVKDLQEALRRTKSGMRRAVRESRPEIEETDPRVEPEAAAPELEIPDPVITIKPEPTPLDPIVLSLLDEEELSENTTVPITPIPRTRNHVVTPSSTQIAGLPSSLRARVMLAAFVAILTTGALLIGYLVGSSH